MKLLFLLPESGGPRESASNLKFYDLSYTQVEIVAVLYRTLDEFPYLYLFFFSRSPYCI